MASRDRWQLATPTASSLSRARATAGDLHPGVVVFATGLAPGPWVRLPQRLVKGHLITIEPGSFGLGCGVHSPGFGVGPMPDGSLLAGGTRDEGDQSPLVRPEMIERIRRGVGQLLPAARAASLRHAWCCFRPATADGQPVVDQVPGLADAWLSAGHDGTGILMAPAIGRSLATWIATGERPEELASFALSRFGPRSQSAGQVGGAACSARPYVQLLVLRAAPGGHPITSMPAT